MKKTDFLGGSGTSSELLSQKFKSRQLNSRFKILIFILKYFPKCPDVVCPWGFQYKSTASFNLQKKPRHKTSHSKPLSKRGCFKGSYQQLTKWSDIRNSWIQGLEHYQESLCVFLAECQTLPKQLWSPRGGSFGEAPVSHPNVSPERKITIPHSSGKKIHVKDSDWPNLDYVPILGPIPVAKEIKNYDSPCLGRMPYPCGLEGWVCTRRGQKGARQKK